MSSQKEYGSTQKASAPHASSISDAEREVMNVLWARSPLSSFHIVQALADSTDWNPKTIKTLLSRLVKKGFLAYEKEANRYLYFPTISRQEAIRRESSSFLDRVFRGDAASMLLHFVRSTELSPEEREELKALLDGMPNSPPAADAKPERLDRQDAPGGEKPPGDEAP
ncbi:MAG: BlaI/MecI/CopY family transcriptional regulator [Acidobacteriota bacterium]